MASPVTTSCPAILEESRTATARAWPTLVVLAALWFITFNQVSVEWTINPQYTFGWTVPLLALYLFFERWKCRPATEPVHFLPVLALFVVTLAVGLFPLRIAQEAAPDWRLVNWAIAGATAGLTLCTVYYAGGRSWLLHFAIPICFALIAVPWPVPIEKILIQGLMRIVVKICVEALGFFAIPAVQHGNVIQISSGKVGVEEACSGVRSLQTTLMASIFLGELFRFTVARRALLLAGGLLLAFVCNLGRSFSLVWITAQHGTGSALKWHDSVGLTVLIVSLIGLGALCTLLRTRRRPDDETPPLEDARWSPRFAPLAVVVAAACWVVFAEVGTELWYRAHESGRAFAAWSVRFPTERPNFREIELSETVRAMLRYDEGRSAAWGNPDGTQWQMNFLRWSPGRASAQLARSHGPELCLAANGAQLRDDLGIKPIQAAGFVLPVHAYTFVVRDTPLYVFYCLWEDHGPDDGPQSTRQEMTQASRLREVFDGRRNTGQQAIEVAVVGLRSFDEAQAETTRLLGDLIRP